MRCVLVLALSSALLVPASAWGGEPDEAVELDPQQWRAVAEGLPAYDEYRQRRLVLTLRTGELIGPGELGYRRSAFREDNASLFYIVVEGEAEYRLTYGDLIRLSGDPVVVNRYERFVASARRDQRSGVILFGVGVGFAVASLIAGSVAFDQWNAAWTPAVLPSLFGCTVSFMLAGGGLAAKGKQTERQLREDYRLERILDRDEAWAAVQRHNAALRRELGLPDDERMDAPATVAVTPGPRMFRRDGTR